MFVQTCTTTLQMPSYSTTLLGVLQGVTEFFGIPRTAAGLFGGSGHAFLINIHEALCPSGPYVWNRGPMEPLIRSLGIEMVDEGFFPPSSSAADRAAIEALIRQRMDAGLPTSVVNLEHQLITGYDGAGFTLAKPWRGSDFPAGRFSCGSWDGLDTSAPTSFFSFRPCTPAAPAAIFAESLRVAVLLHRSPASVSRPPYYGGDDAYGAWIAAIPEYGTSHGNWWNAAVWAECRGMAAWYFEEAAVSFPAFSDAARSLASDYRAIAGALEKVGVKELDPAEKIAALQLARATEAGCVERMAALG